MGQNLEPIELNCERFKNLYENILNRDLIIDMIVNTIVDVLLNTTEGEIARLW